LNALRHGKKFKGKPGKGKFTRACQKNQQMSKSLPMKLCPQILVALFLSTAIASSVSAQAMARSPAPSTSNAAQIEILTKKIDEQNAKIDMLSQQILKLEQQLSGSRPGTMVGDAAASPAASSPTPVTSMYAPSAQFSASPTPSSANGNSHVVARGETLTSIAKMHNVSVSELQKFNHIENDRKLQIGQTIMLPASTSPAPPASSPPQ
jgi:LysM repeat protein